MSRRVATLVSLNQMRCEGGSDELADEDQCNTHHLTAYKTHG